MGDDDALIGDVAFSVPDDLNDIGAVTLLLGVRDNDVKGAAPTDLDQTAVLNADPAGQKEHCLRSPDQVEPNGSQEALDDCRTFIRETLLAALDGLDANGNPDGNKREQLQVTLAIRGQITVGVPLFYLRAGRALHAIEDSFTHTFRNVADRHQVTVVLNWIKYADDDLNESVDGPPHMKELDRCDDPDALRAERRHLAIEAASAALSAVLDPSVPRTAKGPVVDRVLDKYLVFDAKAHCTADNHWCDAPELAYMPSGCGCSLGSGRSAATPLASLLWAGAALAAGLRLTRARRRASSKPNGRTRHVARRLVRRRAHPVSGPLLLLAMTAAPRMARATESSAEKNPGLGSPFRALSGNSKAGTPGSEDKVGAFFGRVALGASYDKPGFSGGIGARYQFSKPLMFGFDAEWNPFYVPSPIKVKAGVLNTYFSVMRRFQLKSDSLNVRTTAGLGTSVLLFDLVGAPAGSVGPFFGLSFLGVEWKATPGFYVTIDPAYIAFPVPHLTGAPFGYLQYRFLVGIEFGGV